MTRQEIYTTINSLQLGDKLSINDWRAKYTVCGISKNFVVAHYGQHYTIISRRPAEYSHNAVREDDMYCGPDWWIFGYVNGYNFTSEEWNKEYLLELEIGTTEISERKRAPIWFISVVGHTDKVYAKKKAP